MNEQLDDFSLLVTINSHEDLILRPHYEPQIDPKHSKLAEVLAPYHFAEPYPCGLSTCRTPHQSGFLVITVDGKEANVGGICGRKIFGDDFAVKANLQDRRAQLKRQLEKLQNARDSKTVLLSRIAEQLNRPMGVKWAESTFRDFKAAVGQGVFKVLREKARRNESVVELTREANKEERDRHRIANPSAKPLQFVSEKIGELTGLNFLNYDPARTLTELKDRLHLLDAIVDPKALSPRVRKEWVDWTNNIERTFENIEDVLTGALRFFTSENLKIISALGATPQEQLRLAKIRWSSAEMRLIYKNLE